LAQLAHEDGIEVEATQQSATPFDPHLFFGVAHQPQQVIEDYLTTSTLPVVAATGIHKTTDIHKTKGVSRSQ
jgi:hypothetical protein